MSFLKYTLVGAVAGGAAIALASSTMQADLEKSSSVAKVLPYLLAGVLVGVGHKIVG